MNDRFTTFQLNHLSLLHSLHWWSVSETRAESYLLSTSSVNLWTRVSSAADQILWRSSLGRFGIWLPFLKLWRCVPIPWKCMKLQQSVDKWLFLLRFKHAKNRLSGTLIFNVFSTLLCHNFKTSQNKKTKSLIPVKILLWSICRINPSKNFTGINL